jgi:ATP-dependent DNA helicase RecG
VGRGEHQSYCILLADSPTAQGEQRLQIIEETSDGFALAEEDLKMRGPGEFFGTRQSGLPDLRVAKLSDVKVLEEAREAALEIFEQDPWLEDEEHLLLAGQVARFWQSRYEEKNAGDLS